jgi:circadian clock protein KaiC
MYALYEWLLDRGMTAILTVKSSEGNNIFLAYEFLEFMADCVVRLVQRPGEWISTRELQVIKYRGSDFGRNAYPFVIQAGGVSVIPISQLDLQHQAPGAHVSSGSTELDRVLGGGYRRGSSVLVAGASGTGKTTTVHTFVKAACERKEKVLCLAFEESAEAILEEMLSPGIDLRPAIDAGLLNVASAMPEAYGTEMHLIRAFTLIDEFKPAHVVVDAISSFERMGTQRAAFEFAMRLVHQCKNRGITTLLVNQSAAGPGEQMAISGLGVSSTVDAILWLRFIDTGSEIKRVLLVVKSRGSKHSTQYHEFLITDDGVAFPKGSPGDRHPTKGEGTK